MCKPVPRRAAGKGQRVRAERCSQQPSVRDRCQPHVGFSLIVEGVDGSKEGLLGAAIPSTSAVVEDKSLS